MKATTLGSSLFRFSGALSNKIEQYDSQYIF